MSFAQITCYLQVSEWKLCRKVILRGIDDFLARLCGRSLHETVEDVSAVLTDVHNNISTVFSELYGAVCTSQRPEASILVIDDNMHYASMRYQLYQLARKCE